MLRPRSLRARLTLAAAATTAIVLAIVWFLLSAMFENHIERLLEDDLQSRLLELAGALTLDANGRPALTAEPTDPRYSRPAGGAYWRISENGKTFQRSLSLWDGDITPTNLQHFSPTGVAHEEKGPDGSIVYVAEREVTLDDGPPPRQAVIAVALDTGPVERLRRSFENQAIIALAVIGVVLSLGIWVQANFGLGPLRALQRQLAQVRSGEATRMRGQFPREVAPLVEDLNKLLERQEDLVRRARERAGDLAHGLKTPLTILQGEARLAEQRGEHDLAESLREQIAAMNTHVARELTRARMSGAAAGGGALVDPRGTIERLIRIMRRMPRGDAIDWRNDLPEGARLRIDPDDFGEIAGNLLDNGRKYAKSVVRIGVDGENEAARVVFDDDGPGVPTPDRGHILQRGQRASADADGSGLGLSIVIEALAQYGLELTLEASPLGGCRVAFAALGLIDAPSALEQAPEAAQESAASRLWRRARGSAPPAL